MKRKSAFEILYDNEQEGRWIASLHPRLSAALLSGITGSHERNASVANVLKYDRPDAVILHDNEPILVIERTVEVPTGHNVGQRFPRLAAAAQHRVPIVHVVPYAAYKHGGKTKGPRYMNLRLFLALDVVARIEKVAIAVINWPVDRRFEIIRNTSKDNRVKEYLRRFFEMFDSGGIEYVNSHFAASRFNLDQLAERENFIRDQVRRPAQYEEPPPSVLIGRRTNMGSMFNQRALRALPHAETVLYQIGMKNIRSDPFTGTAMLYEYLYAGGPTARTRNVVLAFPEIAHDTWKAAALPLRASKPVRLYRQVADAIVFSDGLVLRADL